ncbi:ribonuclease P protein component [Lichenifustis flavocetrariae]|uniref:Ribonuclease P protein component n=1 Tax=Lichenifustis flavocetrariae TaxID=2949735 RepID=A0AA41YXZ4_9HYPH|nr:ribonuclease P protein component [Lichenifustis flavocetrariae]MCW6510634.1 ribonuclease P protein component [Lichenifustis flavocetrariae]
MDQATPAIDETEAGSLQPRHAIPVRLKKRSDFLRVASGRKSHASLFTVQMGARAGSTGMDLPRVGFTVTKKVGGAVERNRIKRRLREVVRLRDDLGLRPVHDYVIVARREILSARSEALARSLKFAIEKVHAAPRNGRGPRGKSLGPSNPES